MTAEKVIPVMPATDAPHTRTAGEAAGKVTPGADMHFAGLSPSKRLARSQPRPRRLLLVRLVWPHSAARDREEVVKVPPAAPPRERVGERGRGGGRAGGARAF